MKLLKKITVCFATIAMIITISVTASAAKVYDWWKDANLSEVDTYADYLKTIDKRSADFEWLYHGLHWKLEAPYEGTFTLNIECTAPEWGLSICNSDGVTVKATDASASIGKAKFDPYSNLRFTRDSAKKTTKTKVTFKLKKDTYYILFTNYSNTGGNLSYNSNFARPKIDDTFTISMKKGSSVQLEAGNDLTWNSSKKTVATVSNSGKITAKKTGTTVITATNGLETLKIKVKVK